MAMINPECWITWFGHGWKELMWFQWFFPNWSHCCLRMISHFWYFFSSQIVSTLLRFQFYFLELLDGSNERRPSREKLHVGSSYASQIPEKLLWRKCDVRFLIILKKNKCPNHTRRHTKIESIFISSYTVSMPNLIDRQLCGRKVTKSNLNLVF